MPKPLLPERPIAAVFQILIALADQPLHGYGIMLDIAERSDGKVKSELQARCTARSSRCSKTVGSRKSPAALRPTTNAGGITG